MTATRAALPERARPKADRPPAAPVHDPVLGTSTTLQLQLQLSEARPEALRPEQVQRLQAAAGNAAVAQLLRARSATGAGTHPLPVRPGTPPRPRRAAPVARAVVASPPKKNPTPVGPVVGAGPSPLGATSSSIADPAPAHEATPLQRSACGCDCGGTCKDNEEQQKPADAAAPVQRRAAALPVQRGFNPLGAVADLAKKAANAAMGVIKGMASSAMSTAASLGAAAASKAAALGASIKAGIASAGAAAVGRAAAAAAAVTAAVRSGATAMQSAVKGLGAKITGTIKGVGAQVLAKARSLGAAALAAGQRLGAAAVSGAKAAGGKALSWMRSKGSAIASKAVRVGGKVFGFANKASGGLLGKAAAVGAGVLGTLRSTASALKTKASSLATRVWETVKKDPCKCLAMLTPVGLLANSAIGKGIASIGTKAKGLGKKALTSISAGGKRLWGLVTNKNGSGSALVKGLAAKAKAAAAAYKAKLLGSATAFGKKAFAGAKSLGTKAFSTAKSLATAGWNKAKGLAKDVVGKAKALGTKALATATAKGKALLDGAKSLGTALLGKAKGLGSKIVGTLDGVTGGMASKVQGLASKILGKAAGLLSFVVSFAQRAASAAIDKAKSFAAKALAKAKDAGRAVLDKAKAGGQKLLAKAKDVGTKALSSAKKAAAAAAQFATSTGAQAVGWMKQTGAAAFAKAKSFATKALGAAKSLGAKALAAAKSFGAKAWSGIVSYGGKALSAAKTWGGKALAAAKKGAAAAAAKAKSIVGPKAWAIVSAAGAAAKGVVSKALAGAKAVGKKAAGAVGCVLKAMGIDPAKLDLILSFVPVVSNIKDAISAITGINPLTGEELSPAERLLAAAFAIPGYGNAAKVVAKGGAAAVKATKALMAPLLRLGAKVGPMVLKLGSMTAKKAEDLTEMLARRIKGGTDVAGDSLSAVKHADDIPAVKVPKALHEPTAPKGTPKPGSSGPGKGKGPKGGGASTKQPVKVGGPAKDPTPGGGKAPGSGRPGGSKGPVDDAKQPDVPGTTGGPKTAKDIKAEIDELVARAKDDPLYREEMRTLSQGQPGVPKGAIQWGPGTGPGPLRVEDGATFRSSTYIEEVTTEPIRLYRYSDSKKAREFGPFWSLEPPSGALSNQLDNAVLPEWNDFERLTVIEVPPGTTIYRGPAAGQVSKTHNLPGGGDQVFIPREIDKKPWAVHAGPASKTDDVVAAADEIPVKGTSSPLVEGGGLAAHEAAGGHAIERHVGISVDDLRARLASQPGIPAASTFPDRATAEAAVDATLRANAAAIEAWLKSGGPKAGSAFTAAYDGAGVTLVRGATTPAPAGSVRVVLRPDPKMRSGYRILTAYPE